MPNIYTNTTEVVLNPNNLNITLDPVQVSLTPDQIQVNTIIDPNNLNITLDPVQVSLTPDQIQVNTTIDPNNLNITLDPVQVSLTPDQIQVNTTIDPNNLNITLDPVQVSLTPDQIQVNTTIDPNNLNITLDPVQVSLNPDQIQVNTTIDPNNLNITLNPDQIQVNTTIDPNNLNITLDPVQVSLNPDQIQVNTTIDPNSLNITLDPVQVSLTPDQIQVNTTIDSSNLSISALPSYLVDLFGRLRVSQPIIQLQITQSDPTINYFVTEGQVSGDGTSSLFKPNQACTDMSVSNVNGLRRYRTRVAGLYQAGKSLLVLFTFNFLTQGNLSWVLRSSVSESVTEITVPQNAWNVDKFDGTGPSGISIDQTKAHIGFIGFEWLGVGDVTCGFIHNRIPRLAHVYHHSNALDYVYMKTANLFPSFEIERVNSTVKKRVGYLDNYDGAFLQQSEGGSTFRTICSSLINEGAIDQTGLQYCVSLNLPSSFNTRSAGTIKPLILFRLKPSCINSRVIPISTEASVSTNTDFYVYLLRNPTFSSTITPNFIPLPNKSIEFDNRPPEHVYVTNPLESTVWQGIGNKNSDFVSGMFTSMDILGSDYMNEPELWCLGIGCVNDNQNVSFALIRFMEMI